MCPSNRAALYGLKPSVGLVSRAGVVPLSSTQDTTGPMAKCTYDVAVLLETIAGFDERDEASEFSCDRAVHILKGYLTMRCGVV